MSATMYSIVSVEPNESAGEAIGVVSAEALARRAPTWLRGDFALVAAASTAPQPDLLEGVKNDPLPNDDFTLRAKQQGRRR